MIPPGALCPAKKRPLDSLIRLPGRGHPLQQATLLKSESMFIWNARRVQLAPSCRNEDSAARFSVQERPGRCASAIVSSADTSNMRRPGGIGPCRSDMIMMPPLRSNAARERVAVVQAPCSRTCGVRPRQMQVRQAIRIDSAFGGPSGVLGDGNAAQGSRTQSPHPPLDPGRRSDRKSRAVGARHQRPLWRVADHQDRHHRSRHRARWTAFGGLRRGAAACAK
jgi:hypothetical protein